MTNLLKVSCACFFLVLLSGCGPRFSLVKPAPTKVARSSMLVSPKKAWNKAPNIYIDVAEEEVWTLNGPQLDRISMLGGLKDGKAVVRQGRKDGMQVPVFRKSMLPQDLAAMIETTYRVRSGVKIFTVSSIRPFIFLGEPGFRIEFDYVDARDLHRKGVVTGAIRKQKLYWMVLDAAATHYFKAALPEYEAIVTSASGR